MIEVGQKVRFDPFKHIRALDAVEMRYYITGKIAYINWKHRWFSVVYGKHLRTSFNFCDIGKEVKICGSIQSK